MAFSVKQGSINVPAATGNQGYTGLGFQPKCIIFYTALLAADGYSASAISCIGAATSSSQRFALCWSAGNGFATTGTSRSQNSALAILYSSANVGTPVKADFVSFDSDGFTLNWTVIDALQIVYYIALGGADLTNAKVGTFNLNTATGNQAVTDPGFQPDTVLFFGQSVTADALNTAVAKMSIGAAKSSTKRWSMALNAANGQTMTANVDALHTELTTACIQGLSDTGTLNHKADFVSMDTNGFTINIATAPASAWNIFYIALQGGQFDVGAAAKPTGAATANQDVTVGFQPSGLFLQSWGLAASTSIVADCETSIGGSDGTNHGSIWAEEQDAVLNTVANKRSISTKALSLSTSVSTTNAECTSDIASVTNGFRLPWTTNDAVAKEVCYVAFGSSAVVFEPDEDYWTVRPFPMQAEPVVSVY